MRVKRSEKDGRRRTVEERVEIEGYHREKNELAGYLH